MRNLGNNYKIFLKYDFSQMIRKFPQVDSLGHKWVPGKKNKNKDVKLFTIFGRQCILCFLLGEMRCVLACSGIYSFLGNLTIVSPHEDIASDSENWESPGEKESQ